MGRLVQQDTTIRRHWFKEMAMLMGIQVGYRYPVYENATIHAEIQCEMSDEIPMDIIFDTNPKIATLKQIGWVSEFKDDKPYVATLPFDAPHLQTKCTIRIPEIGSLDEEGRVFEITSITSLQQYPDAYICTLAPLYNNDNEISEVKNEYDEGNYNHIDNELEPDKYDKKITTSIGSSNETSSKGLEEEYSFFGLN